MPVPRLCARHALETRARNREIQRRAFRQVATVAISLVLLTFGAATIIAAGDLNLEHGLGVAFVGFLTWVASCVAIFVHQASNRAPSGGAPVSRDTPPPDYTSPVD